MSLKPEYEKQLIKKGFNTIIGIDEVGRGCWAGPVAVGVFKYNLGHQTIEGVHDSKKISEKKRIKIVDAFDNNEYDVLFAEPSHIDTHGIGRAIEVLILKAIQKHYKKGAYLLIDGQFKTSFAVPHETLVGGDGKYYSIAVASIAAKVLRDTLMKKIDISFPEYGFASHKGYGTKQHKIALEKHGPTEIHRYSYKPVAKAARTNNR